MKPDHADQMHLVLKVNTDDPAILDSHLKEMTRTGFVWFGRGDEQRLPAPWRVEKIEKQIASGVVVKAFLLPTGKNADGVDCWMTALTGIRRELPPPQSELQERWYKGARGINYWFKLEAPQFVAIADLVNQYRRFDNGDLLGRALKNQTSPLYIRRVA